MQKTTSFDFIIIGAGCAGLSLAIRMIESSLLKDKRILLLDKSPKQGNDKTWCFWDKGNISSYWQNAGVVHHQWEKLFVKNNDQSILLQSAPYNYYMIRSGEFYSHCFSKLRNAKNVQVIFTSITKIDSENGVVHSDDEAFIAPIIFSSVLMDEPSIQSNQSWLLQHFRGWWIETLSDSFDSHSADLMNFSTSQQHGCTFLYVLPVSANRALVEYTVFSEEVLDEAVYEEGITKFIDDKLSLGLYTVTEKESGVIPMTDYQFAQTEGRVIFIGTAGGQTKPSTGYTFSFIQKQSIEIVRLLEQNKIVNLSKPSSKFRLYDSILLKVLQQQKHTSDKIFVDLFKKNKVNHLFRFLDNESNLLEDLRILNSVDKSIFIPVALNTLRGK